MAKSQNVFFGIITASGGRSSCGFQSPLPIPALDRFDVHSEHTSDLMTG
jgi:hypothetical protein